MSRNLFIVTFLFFLLVLSRAEASFPDSLQMSCDQEKFGELCKKVAIVAAGQEGAPLPSMYCNGFLIGEDRLQTNAHCIPPHLRKAGAGCSGQIEARFFTGNKSVARKIDCEEVLESTDPHNQFMADYAVLKLKEKIPGVRSFQVDFSGVTDELPLQVPTWNIGDFNQGAELNVESCKVLQRTYSLLNFFESDFPIFSTNCDLTSGNSGSPILDTFGKVRGIVHVALDLELIKANLAAMDPIYRTIEFQPHSLGTNAICFGSEKCPGSYFLTDSVEKRRLEQEYFQSEIFKRKLKEFYARLMSETDLQKERKLNWKILAARSTQFENRQFLVPFPSCLKEKVLSATTLRKTLPIWLFKIVIGEDQRARPEVAAKGERAFEIRLTSEEAEVFLAGEKEPLGKVPLSLCSK